MKKGFTLIELLAVIVILAIIALIATPIVLNIINDTKESATLRSADFYLDALELSIAQSVLKNQSIPDETYNVLENGNLCLRYEDKTCKEELVVEVNGETPGSGTVTITNGNISEIGLSYGDKYIIRNDKNELVYGDKPICELASDSLKTGIELGAKYNCEVKPGKTYTFYVLSNNNDGTTNLIMDQNINSDGTPAGMTGVTASTNASKYNMVAWKEGAIPETAYGPITAMTFLYNATKDWINILPITYNFRDGSNYPGIESINGITKIEPVVASVAPTILGTEIEPMRARMPIYTSANGNKEVSGKTQENEFLYYNLDSTGSSAPYGYWTLSTSGSENAYIVFYDGNVDVGSLATASVAIFSTVVGVRPVITIQL